MKRWTRADTISVLCIAATMAMFWLANGCTCQRQHPAPSAGAPTAPVDGRVCFTPAIYYFDGRDPGCIEYGPPLSVHDRCPVMNLDGSKPYGCEVSAP